MRRAGVGLATGMAVGEAILNIGGWPLLAFAAYRRGHRVVAAAAVAAPLVLTFEFLVASEKGSGGGAGVFLAMVAVAVLIAAPHRAVNVGVFFALGSLGLAWNYTIVYLVVPAALYAALVNIRSGAALGSAAAGTVPGVAWAAYTSAFLRSHPDYNLHKQVVYRPSVANLERALRHSSRYFVWESPELIRWVGLPILAALVLLVAVAWSRRLFIVVPALVGIGLIVASLAARKVLDATPSAYLGYGRFFLAVPALAWFLTYALAETRSVPRPSWLTTNVAIMVIVAFAGASFVGRNLSFTRRLDHIAAVAERRSAGAPVTRTDTVVADCRAITNAARRVRTPTSSCTATTGPAPTGAARSNTVGSKRCSPTTTGEPGSCTAKRASSERSFSPSASTGPGVTTLGPTPSSGAVSSSVACRWSQSCARRRSQCSDSGATSATPCDRSTRPAGEPRCCPRRGAATCGRARAPR